MSNFTPEPWKLETAPGGVNDGWQISSENTSRGKGRYVVLASRGPITGEEFAGNARLMAAAPEMAELLEEAIQAIWENGKYIFTSEKIELVDHIKGLLRRIEGEEETE